LISAMQQMLKKAVTEEQRQDIRKNRNNSLAFRGFFFVAIFGMRRHSHTS
jgi:hypothetical protein